jgi:uncharacterized protein YdaT
VYIVLKFLKGGCIMPWTKRNYPVSMKNLDPRVRGKAVEIANALLEDGSEEGRAIAIATAQAKEWNEDHPVHEETSLPSNSNRQNIHVVPHKGRWIVKEVGENKAHLSTNTKAEAVKKAKQWASDANRIAIIHRKDGTVETSYNYS